MTEWKWHFNRFGWPLGYAGHLTAEGQTRTRGHFGHLQGQPDNIPWLAVGNLFITSPLVRALQRFVPVCPPDHNFSERAEPNWDQLGVRASRLSISSIFGEDGYTI
jgi:hypothetical protein